MVQSDFKQRTAPYLQLGLSFSQGVQRISALPDFTLLLLLFNFYTTLPRRTHCSGECGAGMRSYNTMESSLDAYLEVTSLHCGILWDSPKHCGVVMSLPSSESLSTHQSICRLRTNGGTITQSELNSPWNYEERLLRKKYLSQLPISFCEPSVFL